MSNETELRAQLSAKIGEYAAAKVAPSHSIDGVAIDHDTHRANLLKEIKELQMMIVMLTGGRVARTQLFG